ncbi:MAG: phosphate signaling complex protein PhoU [Phycisphaerales bacterium]
MSHEMELELVRLKRELLTMSARTESRVSEACQSLLDRDYRLAERVRVSDDEIDQMEVDIEAACLRVLALYQPMASDLRFVLAAMRINSALERMADLARSVAKRAMKIAEKPPLTIPTELREMVDFTSRMVADTMLALSRQDADLAKQVRKSDSAIDAKNRELYAWVIREIPGHVDQVQTIIDLLLAARTIERIGDTASQIAEDVIFMIGGAIVRHTPA